MCLSISFRSVCQCCCCYGYLLDNHDNHSNLISTLDISQIFTLKKEGKEKKNATHHPNTQIFKYNNNNLVAECGCCEGDNYYLFLNINFNAYLRHYCYLGEGEPKLDRYVTQLLYICALRIELIH